MMNTNYSMLIQAAKHGLEVIETFLEIWEEEGKSIPEPRAMELVAA